MMTIFALFFALCIGHALCDYPLQGDFLARGKNRYAPLPGVPWYWCLGAHSLIHAGAVWVIVSLFCLFHHGMVIRVGLLFGLAEFALHWITDDTKSSGRISFDADQIVHIVVKASFALILTPQLIR
jgi:hypothetical protein